MMLKKLCPNNGQTKLKKAVLAFALSFVFANSNALEATYQVSRLSAKELVQRYPYALELSKCGDFMIKGLKREDIFKHGKVFHTHGKSTHTSISNFTFPDESPPDDVYKLPEKYKKISVKAFSFFWGKPNYCIRNVIIPEGYYDIGDEAFYGCYNLEKIKLPRSLLCIGHYAFAGTNIKDITFPDNIIYLGDHLFFNGNIKSITAPIDFKFYFYRDEVTNLKPKNSTVVVVEIGVGNMSLLGIFPEDVKLTISKPYIHKISDSKSELRMRTLTVGSGLWNKSW